MSQDNNRAYIALVLVSIVWGTTYVAARVGANQMPGFFVAAVRHFLSGAVLVAFYLLRGYKIPPLATLKTISIQGFFLLCLANGMLTWSMQYLSGGMAAIIVALVPLFVALFSLGEKGKGRITKLMWVGWIAGLAGVIFIFWDYLHVSGSENRWIGFVLAFASVIAWAWGTVYTSRQSPQKEILFGAGLQMFISGAFMLLLCAITGYYVQPSQIEASGWFALGYLVIFGSLIAYSAYVFALAKLPASLVSIYAYINPVVAVLLGWMLLAENINTKIAIGILITLGGVYLVNNEFKKLRHESH
ncbi:MAG: EamA family transporter [Chitinophagaceae bacterium]|nr:EamA family transporter [Chitinophagaceae bacterium]